MCGFLVLNSKSQFDKNIFDKMLNLINHRGPDNKSIKFYNDNKLLLGHVRLSIIDLQDSANQPFTSNCGNFVIVFNGEIFNYKELKKRYFHENSFWKSNSDTELLLELIIKVGLKKALNDIDGQFSFIIYDKIKNTITLVRDIAGEKPLYYGYDQNNLLITSDLRVVKNINFFAKDIDKTAVSSYKLFNYINSDRTIYKSFKKIKPGYFCIIDLQNHKTLKYERYFNLKKENTYLSFEENDLISIFENNLINSLKNKLTSDVPISLMLSSGVDSSLISVLLSEKLNYKIDTYTISFEEKNLNEFNDTNDFCNYFGIPNNEVKISGDAIKSYITIMNQVFSEPFADASQIPTYILCNEISKKYKVCLTGDGADEIFSGYNRHQLIYKFSKFNFFQKKAFNLLFFLLSNNQIFNLFTIFKKFLPNIFKFNTILSKKNIFKYFRLNGKQSDYYFLMIVNLSNYFYNSDLYYSLKKEIHKNYEKYQEEFDELDIPSIYDFNEYLSNNIFVKSDRASMYNSLELRTPYIFKSLILDGINLRDNLKFGNTNKKILRKILSKYSKNFKFSQSKKGFTPPISLWLNTHLKEWVDDTIHSLSFSQTELIDDIHIKSLWLDHKKRKSDNGMTIWNSLVLYNWINEYL